MTYTKNELLLSIEGMSLAYGTKTILHELNLQVHNIVRPGLNQGQVIALLGPSGVGKTQLFRCIAGLQSPSKGRVVINKGLDHLVPVTAGDVGLVFQSYPLFKHHTVIKNLKLAARSKPTEEIMGYLERFGLADKANLYPAQLSGGQRQRIAIIQQLLSSGHYLLMDEPFSGLDVKMRDEAIKVIQEVSVIHEHNTMIVSTHDIDAALRIADTIWVLGHAADVDGKRIPGGVCLKTLDLIDRGLAWNLDAELHPNFVPTLHEIRELFH